LLCPPPLPPQPRELHRTKMTMHVETSEWFFVTPTVAQGQEGPASHPDLDQGVPRRTLQKGGHSNHQQLLFTIAFLLGDLPCMPVQGSPQVRCNCWGCVWSLRRFGGGGGEFSCFQPDYDVAIRILIVQLSGHFIDLGENIVHALRCQNTRVRLVFA